MFVSLHLLATKNQLPIAKWQSILQRLRRQQNIMFWEQCIEDNFGAPFVNVNILFYKNEKSGVDLHFFQFYELRV